jgi:hypothetical protein
MTLEELVEVTVKEYFGCVCVCVCVCWFDACVSSSACKQKSAASRTIGSLSLEADQPPARGASMVSFVESVPISRAATDNPNRADVDTKSRANTGIVFRRNREKNFITRIIARRMDVWILILILILSVREVMYRTGSSVNPESCRRRCLAGLQLFKILNSEKRGRVDVSIVPVCVSSHQTANSFYFVPSCGYHGSWRYCIK